MDATAATFFRWQMQSARENTLKDAEAFSEIINVLERIGAFELGKIENLHLYTSVIKDIAQHSDLFDPLPTQRQYHTPFDTLYKMVLKARNDSFHQGANARHLTQHCVELALIIEDACRKHELESKDLEQLSDYMIRNPITADSWQPISFVRQQMLVNSFSYLPVFDEGWYLISDRFIAAYLAGHTNSERKRRLSKTIKDAKSEGTISLVKATCKEANTSITDLWNGDEKFDGMPILVVDANKEKLIGIVSAFDLL